MAPEQDRAARSNRGGSAKGLTKLEKACRSFIVAHVGDGLNFFATGFSRVCHSSRIAVGRAGWRQPDFRIFLP